MTAIDKDVESIIDEEVDDIEFKILLQDILEYESNKLHKSYRKNRKKKLDSLITEYLEDV